MIAPRIVVAGGTGLIGQRVLAKLSRRPALEVTALVRREGAVDQNHVVKAVTFDFESDTSLAALGTIIPCDVLLCCLGTTRAKAGSDEAFRRVDRDYPLALAKRLREVAPNAVFGLISSIGADRPSGLYLTTKAEAEKGLAETGLRHVIFRPSVLLGEREENRPAERVAAALLPGAFRVLRAMAPKSNALARYAPIQAERVAEAMVHHCIDDPPKAGGRVVEGLELTD